ncbi:MAG TPA: histidine phosphatase family protein [Allosphingosinicella sp.]|nr:histidine phosphatase family protein [Allosphingosinicella sp.]
MAGPEIFLLRHGETEWNAAGRFQGALDSRLTEKGVEQAVDYAGRLALIAPRIAKVAVSPLGRARQTSAIIRSLGPFAPEHVDERLREVSIGSWDGLTHFDIDACWPGLLDGSTAFDWFFRSPDGECYDAAAERAHSWLSEVADDVLAVSHGLTSRIIRGIYLGLPKEDTLRLPVAHGVIWRLSDGLVTTL